jgi:hypothetical protein
MNPVLGTDDHSCHAPSSKHERRSFELVKLA